MVDIDAFLWIVPLTYNLGSHGMPTTKAVVYISPVKGEILFLACALIEVSSILAAIQTRGY